MITFAKTQACGNDFLIVAADQVAPAHRAEAARLLCARTTGVGADGVEFFEWRGEYEAGVHLYNADGSVAEISGNGTRCVAAWMAHINKTAAGSAFRIETDAGWRECRIASVAANSFEIVTRMGTPSFHASSVVLADNMVAAGTLVNTGNPHFVLFVDAADFSFEGRSWHSIGEEISRHADFPLQTNVELVLVHSPHEIEIRIFERGVGPTTSSGTGTCAAATAAIALRGCDAKLRVQAPGGSQQVYWSGGSAEIELTGPAVLIADGTAFWAVREREEHEEDR